MATVNIKAFEHHYKESDKTINLKLVVYHKGKYAYPSTDHYINKNQVNKNFKIIDKDLIATLTVELGSYRKIISNLGRDRLNGMTAQQLGEVLLPSDSPSSGFDKINFIKFGKERIAELKAENRDSYAGTLQAVVNNFTDFMKTDVVYTNEITSDLLKKYEKYLRSPYVQVRNNQFGEPIRTEREGMEDAGIYAHMKNFRILFNAARDKYNDEDTGIIRILNYPFKKYKLKEPPEPEKRSIPIECVRQIRDVQGLKPGGRAELGRDVFMMSFYLCGMNMTDMMLLNEVKNGRVSYNRNKTKGKRSDNAFISIKIIPEVAPLLDKWLGIFSKRYSTFQNFQKAVSKGLAQVAGKIQKDMVANGKTEEALMEFDFYSARHTVGNEARNTLGFSTADVAEALNHAKKTITDAYIRKQWTIVDAIQAAVVDLLNNTTSASNDFNENS